MWFIITIVNNLLKYLAKISWFLQESIIDDLQANIGVLESKIDALEAKIDYHFQKYVPNLGGNDCNMRYVLVYFLFVQKSRWKCSHVQVS